MSFQAPPKRLQTIALVQLGSGLLNVLFLTAGMTVLLSATFGTIGSTCGGLISLTGCSLGGLGSCGWACGLWGLALLPIGALEILAGAVTLVDPERARTVIRAAAVVEVASVLFGGLASAVAGIAVWSLLDDPEVAGYLDRDL